ncbi:hypothetical protein [Bradyrhizobium sp. B117]|uniref:hypothetical protein n=1 Tax=Bradyrhizobium sp. B117 TaxID=3140246 RepID=UPI0031835C23
MASTKVVTKLSDGSTQTLEYLNGVLISKSVAHPNNSRDVFLSNITGQSYVAEHDVYNSAGVLTNITRTHANGSLDYNYTLGSDGAKITAQYDAAGKILARSIVQADGSSDLQTYANGVMVSETVVHANKSKDVMLSNITGQSYVAEHDVYNSAGVLTSITRTHANGSLDFNYTLGSDGAKVTAQYDAAGQILTRSIVQADGSSDLQTYANGLMVSETVVHANKSKDVMLSNITGQSYVAEHDVYNSAGVLTNITHTHANGSLDYNYTLGSDGAKVTAQYDAAGQILTRSIVQADGSSDLQTYANGVMVSETVVHANKSKDVMLSNITGQSYVAEHDVYNSAGVLTNITRTHANGSLDYNYTLGSDGAKITAQYDAAGKILARSIVQADGSSDLQTYANGVMVSETVVHANKSKDVMLSNITGQSYVAEHDVYNSAGVLTSITRTHANGSLDFNYTLGSDGAKVTAQYDAAGKILARSIVQADGSSDLQTYANGVMVSETVVHANKSKDVMLSNITGQSYVAEHDVYNSAGVLTNITRTHANGSLDYNYTLGSVGAKVTAQYDAAGQILTRSIVQADGSSDLQTYANGVMVSETVIHDDKSKDVFLSNIIGQNYVAEHDVYDSNGTLTFRDQTALDGSHILTHYEAVHVDQTRFFCDVSAWNTAINPNSANYTKPDAIQNVQFRDATLGNSWIQSDNGLVNHTPQNAAHMTWNFDLLNQANVGGTFSTHGSIQLATPSNLTPLGMDRDVVFTDPDGVHYWEAWDASYDSIHQTWHASYLVEGNLQGTGWGIANGVGAGIRASGASLLGGLVTGDELNKLSINHALSIVLDEGQLKAGTSQLDQFVFPAVLADSDSVAAYKGTIPMGAHFALPANLDLDHAGLTPEGLALAKAYQQYGGYVVDAAPHTTSLANIDGATDTQLADLRHDTSWIRDHLVMV